MGIMRAAMIGHVAARSARRQMEGMQQQAQAQQAQAQQAQAQAQAQAAQAQAQAQKAQAQAKATTDPMQEIAKLGDLKVKGLITEEEFQKMKASVLAKM